MTQLLDVVRAEQVLMRVFGGNPPAGVAFRLAMVKRDVAPVLDEFRAQRQALLERYAVRTEDQQPQGKTYYFTDEKGIADQERVEQFNAELDNLLGSELALSVKIKLSDLEQVQLDSPLTPNEMVALLALIEDDTGA